MENKNLQVYIDQYIEAHKDVSAMELCTYLIEQNGASTKQYSTGRPKIYIDVVAYLELLLKRGNLSEVKRNREDCIYQVESVQIDSSKPVDTIEEVEQEVDLQLSFFS
jgi:hypothetical protein